MLEEFKNAFSRPNNSHVQLILINVAVFVLMGVLYVFSRVLGLDAAFALVHDQFAIPPKFFDFLQRPWTIVTYAFMHDLMGLLHILFNMVALYWFGRLFVEYLGSDKLIALYLLGALAAGACYLLVFNTIPFFKGQSEFSGMVGASGSIFAIMVAAATLTPNYTFYLLFLGPVRIKYIAAFYIVLSFLGTVQSNAGGNIAHLGGALMGFVYIKQLQVGINWGGWVTSTLSWFGGLFSPRPKVKVSYRKNGSTPKSRPGPAPGVSQQEIDDILDKISDGGYESLSKEEREKLFKASKK
ncbi:MAG: rhomboid family intramembrane serine protease [Cytophagales bacterium]|nr:rhomboid family intramembrane serine protease [Cytophagales bacterium]